MMENSIDNYFTRKEWLENIKSTYCDIPEYISYSKQTYKIVRLKNELVKFCILYTKNKGIALDFIQTIFDYSCIELNTNITNNFLVKKSLLVKNLESEKVSQKIQSILYEKNARRK